MVTNIKNTRKKTKKYGSDYIVDVLEQHDIEYIACNPGATFRGLHDSIVNYHDNKKPQLILCCHEEIAIAIAHGYAKASGRYMAALIHSNVGLQHASMAIFNAWCNRVPMLILGGIGPMDSIQRRPWIDWIHTSNYHPTMINDYVKWHDQPSSLPATVHSIYRACRITNTEPKSPVYIGIDSTLQENIPKQAPSLKDINKFRHPSLPQASQNDLQQLAEELVGATFPVIIVDHIGRNPDNVDALVHLVELLSLPVIDCGGRYNFPNTHPLCLTGAEVEILGQSDLILAFDVEDLSGTLVSIKDKKFPRITHVTMSDFLISKWAADYQELIGVDRIIAASSANVTPALFDLCQSLLTENSAQHNIDRAEKLSTLHFSLRQTWLAEAKQQHSSRPMTVPVALLKIWEAIKNEDWCLVNHGSVSNGLWVRKLWDLSRENCYLGFSGGAGLGYGLGASIGASLALKGSNKLCINLQSDGDFLFTPSALWTMMHHHIPVLIIMINNREYHNTKMHSINIAKQRGRNIENANIGSSLNSPSVNFPDLARSFGMSAYDTIRSVDDVVPILEKAIDLVKQGSPALIDLIVQ